MERLFDDFVLDREGSRLLQRGVEVSLERRSFDLLCYLADHRGRLIRKEELLAEVWRAHALTDGVLSNAVAKLRKALGQSARAQTPIETVHGRGYRLHLPEPNALQPTASAPTPARESVPVDPFVGRSAALMSLDECLSRADSGSGQLLLLTGEAGIGKSRTLAELSRRARQRGFSVWEGAAYAGDATPAYWPWVEVVRCALADPTARDHIPRDAWALATLAPELLGAARPDMDADSLRFRLFDELTRWLASAAMQSPRLIVLEDVHWAESASVELLAHLAQGLARQRVLLAAALRDYEPQASQAKLSALQRLSRSANHVALVGLSHAELAELVHQVAGGTADEAAIALLHTRTHGNPFFARQVLQLLHQTGRTITVSNLESGELPPAARDVINQRLAPLPADARELLSVASVIGDSFDAALLARVLGRELASALAALDPSVQLGLIRARPAQAHHFDFQHALLRESVYDGLSLVERGNVHARLTQVLSERASGADALLLNALARHSALAVPFDLGACVQHCRRAAQAARDASGFEAAAALSLGALAKLETFGGDSELRCQVMFELGLDQLCAGEIQAGRDTLERGARLARELGATPWLARFASRLVHWGDVGAIGSDLRSLVDDGLEQLGDNESESDLRAMLLARRAELGWDLGIAQRRELLAEAERVAARSGAPDVLLEVALARVCQRDPTQLEQSRIAIADYRLLEQQHPRHSSGVQRRLRGLAVELAAYWRGLVAGDVAAADLATLRCESLAQQSRVPQFQCLVEMMRVARAIGDGRLDDATAGVARLRPSSDLPGGFGLAWMFYDALIADARDQLAPLVNQSTQLDVRLFEQLPPRQRLSANIWLASVLAKTNNHALARELMTMVPSADRERMPVHYGDLRTLCLWAEACCALEDRPGAARLYDQLAPHAALNSVGVGYDYRGSVAHYLGMLALLLRRKAQAREHWLHALAFNRRLGMTLQVQRTQALLDELSPLA